MLLWNEEDEEVTDLLLLLKAAGVEGFFYLKNLYKQKFGPAFNILGPLKEERVSNLF